MPIIGHIAAIMRTSYEIPTRTCSLPFGALAKLKLIPLCLCLLYVSQQFS